jgi:hypothetical protein
MCAAGMSEERLREIVREEILAARLSEEDHDHPELAHDHYHLAPPRPRARPHPRPLRGVRRRPPRPPRAVGLTGGRGRFTSARRAGGHNGCSTTRTQALGRCGTRPGTGRRTRRSGRDNGAADGPQEPGAHDGEAVGPRGLLDGSAKPVSVGTSIRFRCSPYTPGCGSPRSAQAPAASPPTAGVHSRGDRASRSSGIGHELSPRRSGRGVPCGRRRAQSSATAAGLGSTTWPSVSRCHRWRC